MKLSTKGRYAVMALVDIAAQNSDKPICLNDISQRQELPIQYMEQLFAKLRKAGIIDSIRGATGGYYLSKPAAEISISQIINAVDEPIKATRCSAVNNDGCLSKKGRCLTHNLWAGLSNHIHDYLKSITLADVCSQQESHDSFVYLDHNATSPLIPEVKIAMTQAMGVYGNPSSVHTQGRKAKSAIESAREIIALNLGTGNDRIIFTSGGTEANNLGLGWPSAEKTIRVVASTEHESVSKSSNETVKIPVLENGIIDLDQLKISLQNIRTSGKQIIVGIMLANNETGVIQPVREVANIAHQYGGFVHCDAVQAFCKIPLNFDELGVDSMAISSHKIGGPKGVGALILGPKIHIPSIISGGGQERGYRAGTENVMGIIGFGQAIQSPQNQNIQNLRDFMESSIIKSHPATIIFSKDSPRLPNTSMIAMPGVNSQTQIIKFDLEKIAVSVGSACSSGKVKPSHVLKAMGVDEQIASCAIRVSLGWNTTKDDIEKFIKVWSEIYEQKQRIAA